jgi:interleukin 18 receptor accessory protein
MACCVKIVLEVKPQTNTFCENSVPHKKYLHLGTTDSIYCPSVSCQSDAQRPEMTWYQVRVKCLKLMNKHCFYGNISISAL